MTTKDQRKGAAIGALFTENEKNKAEIARLQSQLDSVMETADGLDKALVARTAEVERLQSLNRELAAIMTYLLSRPVTYIGNMAQMEFGSHADAIRTFSAARAAITELNRQKP